MNTKTALDHVNPNTISIMNFMKSLAGLIHTSTNTNTNSNTITNSMTARSTAAAAARAALY